MSNIAKAFEKGKAFIPFITCGDPSLEATEKIVYAMEEAGADLIELGIPFSDPTAEGPVIQEANIRALSGGVTTDKRFDMVVKIRKNTKIPMVFMTYANVVFSYGTEPVSYTHLCSGGPSLVGMVSGMCKGNLKIGIPAALCDVTSDVLSLIIDFRMFI